MASIRELEPKRQNFTVQGRDLAVMIRSGQWRPSARCYEEFRSSFPGLSGDQAEAAPGFLLAVCLLVLCRRVSGTTVAGTGSWAGSHPDVRSASASRHREVRKTA